MGKLGVGSAKQVGLTVCLLLATASAFGLVLTGIVPDLTTPALARQTLLVPNLAVICLRSGCGCEKRPMTWRDEAVKADKPILILLDAVHVTRAEEAAYLKSLSSARVFVVRTDSAQLLKRYAPSGRSTLTVTRFGAPVAQSAEAGAEKMLEVATR